MHSKGANLDVSRNTKWLPKPKSEEIKPAEEATREETNKSSIAKEDQMSEGKINTKNSKIQVAHTRFWQWGQENKFWGSNSQIDGPAERKKSSTLLSLNVEQDIMPSIEMPNVLTFKTKGNTFLIILKSHIIFAQHILSFSITYPAKLYNP